MVNRYNVSEELIGRVIDAGYAYMEEQHEQARQLASEREIVGRIRDAAPSFPRSLPPAGFPPTRERQERGRESSGSDGHEEDHGGGDDHRALHEGDSNVTLPHQGAGNPDVWKQQ